MRLLSNEKDNGAKFEERENTGGLAAPHFAHPDLTKRLDRGRRRVATRHNRSRDVGGLDPPDFDYYTVEGV